MHLRDFVMYIGYGVITDLHTSYTCRIMLLSVIPLLIIQIPSAFHLNQAGERILLLLTLTISIAFLICYFFYQVIIKNFIIFDPTSL